MRADPQTHELLLIQDRPMRKVHTPNETDQLNSHFTDQTRN